MVKRRFFLALAAALFATVAFSPASQAGSTFMTTVDFVSSSPAITEIDVFYSGAGTLSGLTPVSPLPPTVNYALVAPNEVVLTFAPSTGPITINYDLTSTSAFSSIGISNLHETFVSNSGVEIETVGTGLTNLSVPEPASLALLGIGMTGFLAFRRFFKKTAVA